VSMTESLVILPVTVDLVKPALPLSVLLIGFSRLARVPQKFCLTGTLG